MTPFGQTHRSFAFGRDQSFEEIRYRHLREIAEFTGISAWPKPEIRPSKNMISNTTRLAREPGGYRDAQQAIWNALREIHHRAGRITDAGTIGQDKSGCHYYSLFFVIIGIRFNTLNLLKRGQALRFGNDLSRYGSSKNRLSIFEPKLKTGKTLPLTV